MIVIAVLEFVSQKNRKRSQPMFKRNDIEHHSSPKVQCKPASPNIPADLSADDVNGSSRDDGRVRNLSTTCLKGKLPLSDKGKNSFRYRHIYI